MPVLTSQGDHAAERRQQAIVAVFDSLLNKLGEDVTADPGYTVKALT